MANGVQCLLDQTLAFRIKAGSGLVKKKQLWFFDQRPGNGNSLTLTAGQAHATLAQKSFVLIGHVLDKFTGMGLPGGLLNLVNPGFGTPIRSEEHTSELQSRGQLVCRLQLNKKKADSTTIHG